MKLNYRTNPLQKNPFNLDFGTMNPKQLIAVESLKHDDTINVIKKCNSALYSIAGKD